ncbi:putative disease resistance protein At3g14460 [Arachis ipaensis]|uniref:putative disease resistance protein At3g14460 n=1 Tax=Arachis ipaensis TaxID=130454 RepID=UPI0007AFC524|nr:putative disease resistance protein At3g14460 [Arachis ipaensis]XP_020971153.1 putative disease resistance protein At3g14460 [Arachis ipaensis]XP_020971154.1 putative disease resistance protein At3g14460 [Arachis ipaensis]XP_020971155.1 putative disease resistance protein At3g14460 [Arachis ipaensis]XP_020971156.1 putative disease resistance protein At3g14460 [Arachis ipaensis]XP_020971157.1 putative disease resistance protein At3g14460 [Arachis ipaensis]XP_025632256.1 putative disease res
MAGALIGGAFLSGFINVVFDRFLTKDSVNLILGKKLGSDLVERLKISLHAAEALVGDAEYKQLDNPSVKDWLNCLKDAVYMADDLLNVVLMKAATRKEVRSFWPISFLNPDRDMVDKMEGVVRRIEFLEKQKDFLGLKVIPKDNNLAWRASTSLVEGNIYGREDDQQALLKIISDNSESQLSVIPIVGMGGVGKTTLAKWVYSVIEGFDLKAWICISETFDVADIIKTIIEEVTRSPCTLQSLNSLQLELKRILWEKKFLIVLDDVWNDDADSWKKFKTPFHGGAKGSTMLLTTRIKEVASIVQTYPSYFLNELSEDYCWLVFADNSCFLKSNDNSALEEIGRKIVKKCKGLPLAAETLGRLLRGKEDVKEWNVVLTSDIWEFSMKNSKIVPALLISYFQLPAYLKRCFVYCSLYPKDHEFVKDELILLWIAEDLLRPLKKGETLEEVGRECFDELASRHFFKQHDHFYKMHDLLHDLAIFLAGDFYCRLELGNVEAMTTLTRHLSFESLSHLISENFGAIEYLRTFMRINFFSHLDNNDGVTFILMSKLKYLRVLSFSLFKGLDVLPDTIGELTYLRYLNLSKTSIKSLPESLCDLYNLQTLKLDECSSLTMLPNGMHRLVNLRHLCIWRTCLKEMPGGMSKLKQLHILHHFIMGKHEDNGIQELGGLLNIHGSFGIKNLENVVDVTQARSARILDKKHIDRLVLKWSSSDDMVSNTQTERDILGTLQPHNGLKILKIKGYRGTIFPNWVGHYSYQNMTGVCLESCNNCCMLPSLGQLPSLKALRIEGFGRLKSVGMEFYKNEGDHHSSPIAPFPALKTLEFWSMPCWEVWHLSDSETFPQLKNLQITNCPMLKGDMLNHLFLRIVSSFLDASKVHKLDISEDHEGWSRLVSLKGDTLSIKGCETVVESAFKAVSINHLTCIQEIRISHCSFAVSFPGNCLHKSLQKLTIWHCEKLEFPQQQQQKYDLVELQIHSSCDSLSSLSLDAFPNLKTLKISGCENLESVSISQPPHTALQRLSIHQCPKFMSFTGEGLAEPNLTHFEVNLCDKLEALPSDMNSLLPNLDSVDSREICRLPDGGLPPNLKQLIVNKQLRGLSSMGNFNTLTHLTIQGYVGVRSFPEVASLPHLPYLITLRLYWFPDLETLECNQLLCLNSLQKLKIGWCPKLENMTGEKLPPSLSLFKIKHCPLLGEHFKNKHQQLWPKISHILTIKVDDEQIF